MILSDFHSEGAHTKDLFPANDESSRTDTKHRKVAMLSEELKPLGDGHTIFGDGADQLGQNTITDYVSSDHSPASSLLFSPTTSVTSLSSINLTDMNTAPPFPSNRLWGSVGVRENSQFLQPSLSLFNAAQGQALLQPAVPLVGPVDTTRRIDRLRAQRQAITHRSQIVPVTHGNSARPSSGNFNVPPTAMDGADVINIMGEHYVRSVFSFQSKKKKSTDVCITGVQDAQPDAGRFWAEKLDKQAAAPCSRLRAVPRDGLCGLYV